MDAEPPTLLIVDSDQIHREIIEGMLEDELCIFSASSGSDALKIIEQQNPDIIITESTLSDIHGFDLCKQIKAKSNNNSVVVFLSEPLTFEEKMAGYEAGGDDFLDKPFQPEELLSKIRLNVEVKNLHRRLESKANQAIKTTMVAMKQSSEMGTLLRFMEKAADSENFGILADELLTTLDSFNLQCCTQFRNSSDAYHFGCVADSADATLLSMCIEKGRFIDIGANCIVNTSSTSILVSNMPITDKDRYGEIKDLLAIVSNATNSRVESINRIEALANKTRLTADEAVSQSHIEIQNVKELLSQHSHRIQEIMDILHDKMGTTCLKLGLTDYQETDFMEMVDESMDALEKTCKDIVNIDHRFTSVVDSLADFIHPSNTSG